MYCKKCGSELEENANFCPKCGTPQQETPAPQNTTENHLFDKLKTGSLSGKNTVNPVKGKKPRCTHCGYVGNWKLGPLLRPIDFIIGIAFLLFGILPGLIYMGVVAVIRYNPDRREKICPQCKAQNLWTFIE